VKKFIKFDLITLKDLENYEFLLFFDCEYTCWENSAKTKWSDKERYPEVLQIGLVIFNILRKITIYEFSRYIRPKTNYVLSTYCKNLLRINQTTISKSFKLNSIVELLSDKIRTFTENNILATCSWGFEDRIYFYNDCKRNNCKDPFLKFPHLDLMRVSSKHFFPKKHNNIEREVIKKLLGINYKFNRHNALEDSRDLIIIYKKLTSITC